MEDQAIDDAHYNDREFAMYFQGGLSPEQAATMEAHLADCDVCVARARKEYRMTRESVLPTPEEFGRAYEEHLDSLRDCVTAGLRAAASRLAPEIRTRFAEWLKISRGWEMIALGLGYYAVPDTVRSRSEMNLQDVSSQGTRIVLRPKATPAGGNPDLQVFQIPVRNPELAKPITLLWNPTDSQWVGDLDPLEEEYVVAVAPAIQSGPPVT